MVLGGILRDSLQAINSPEANFHLIASQLIDRTRETLSNLALLKNLDVLLCDTQSSIRKIHAYQNDQPEDNLGHGLTSFVLRVKDNFGRLGSQIYR